MATRNHDVAHQSVAGADGGGDYAEGDGPAAGGVGSQQEGRWASGMCALFPGTTSVIEVFEKERKGNHLWVFVSVLVSETVAVLAASPAVVRYSASNTPRQWTPWSSLGT